MRHTIAVKTALAFLLLLASLGAAAAMQPCPSQDERLKSAEIVVEARVRSLTIGDSGIMDSEGINPRMIRAELEFVKAIKGDIKKRDIVAYGTSFSFALLKPLTTMAVVYDLGPEDTLELELSIEKIEKVGSLYTLDDCAYWKLPDGFADAMSD
ncbi:MULTISPECIES: hypothetical protein [Agrobacterium]|uniref:Uncharacterized protein n=1 Tax=Agrobacterium tumefaciens TaxID=358 RepID=A0AAE6EEM6_AGRTU|nr:MULTISPECIES: hypothetical protein [Agrobacterium]QCL73421.1 hypothetical protein CFBP5499_08330 [Agrobacterium tumefaciens]QCL78993.1 hypothetical protein CFBP5877_07860 [Agrobacterium tumefaciens]CUX42191.1 conserved exported hypothetical protein [Agrobacterium sp. NCPPB 925]